VQWNASAQAVELLLIVRKPASEEGIHLYRTAVEVSIAIQCQFFVDLIHLLLHGYGIWTNAV
jgi:hypothetical protein